MNEERITLAGIPLKSDKLIISGPCSAETEEQVFLAASQLAMTNKVDVLRAGIWKPRTRPNSFEGVGEEGLVWLKNAGKKFNLPVTTEVANAAHVEAALKADIDILWIGARTTVNPFSVQEIADALKGVDIPMMIKNPINPDLELWLGAVERFQISGKKNILAIHRGFSSFGDSVYRNSPMWEIPIQFKLRMPEIPMICDPSHITGRRDRISEISQKAYDMAMDGLMIESHPNPDDAWSDAAQQITALRLEEILEHLEARSVHTDDLAFLSSLEKLRTTIDLLDESVIQTLAKRMEVAKEIGQYKKENKVTILQTERWLEIFNQRKQLGNKLGLSDKFIEEILAAIHSESIQQQNAVMNAGL